MFIISVIPIIIGLIVRNFHSSKILFYDWDEGMYAQIATEILKNKSLFTTFNGHIWLDKPPLVHTLIAVVFSLFDRSEFWARMLMVIVSTIVLFLTYFLAKKIFKAFFNNQNNLQTFIASFLPVLILSSSPIFLERATLLNSDIFIAVSWLGYFLFWDKYWPKLFFLTIGVLSKSVLGFYPLLIELMHLFFIFICFPKQIKINREKIVKSFIFIVIPSIWYIAGTVKFGLFFIDNHFLSQVLKRLYVPIELHFGNKYFYFSNLWNDLGLITILITFAYILFTHGFLKSLIKEKCAVIKSPKWLATLVLFTPLPFLGLLTIMKTKIAWYMIIFLPFLCLSISYLYLKLKNYLLKIIIVISVVIYFLFNFPKQTFLFKGNYTVPDKLKLAQCLSKTKPTEIAFLVDEDERKIKNFLEAAHYDTTSSFFYGGSPSFVYYLKKKTNYYYDLSLFSKNLLKNKILVLSKKDFDSMPTLVINLNNNYKLICQYDKWLGFIEK